MSLVLQKLTLIKLSAAEWVRHSLLWKCFNPLRNWHQHSFLMQWGTELSVCLLTALFAIAPFVGTATAYIGLIEVGCAGLWLLLTLSDDAPQPSRISPVHGLLALYWVSAALSTALSPVKKEAISGLAELSLARLAHRSLFSSSISGEFVWTTPMYFWRKTSGNLGGPRFFFS
jgi:putative inorganic carbon (hco3(-)) transporter